MILLPWLKFRQNKHKLSLQEPWILELQFLMFLSLLVVLVDQHHHHQLLKFQSFQVELWLLQDTVQLSLRKQWLMTQLRLLQQLLPPQLKQLFKLMQLIPLQRLPQQPTFPLTEQEAIHTVWSPLTGDLTSLLMFESLWTSNLDQVKANRNNHLTSNVVSNNQRMRSSRKLRNNWSKLKNNTT